MKCLVVTPEKTVLDLQATSVVMPLFDGDYGVMPGHTPVIARLGAGELRVHGTDGKLTQFYVEGGFVEVLDDVVALLTMHAVPASQLNLARAEEQLKTALERPSNTPELAALKGAVGLE